MSKTSVPLALAALTLAGFAAPLQAAADLPAWAQSAAAHPAPTDDEAGAQLLLEEGFIDISADGHRITRERTVLRILRPEGRAQARRGVAYMRPGDKIRDFNAWIRTKGGLRRFGRKDVVDIALEPEALYSESRYAMLDLADQAEVGSICAWESVKDVPPTIAEDEWDFQADTPVAVSRCIVRVPAGWSLAATLLNHPPVEPALAAEGRSWELRDLPGWQTEPFAPTARPASARLRFTYAPPAGAKPQPDLVVFRSWAEVAAFGRTRFATALQSDPALRTKTAELCAGTATQWDKIRAIAGYVQTLRYIGISINLRQLGGYEPHPAPEVLRCGYGDCKDKAALLCTMLAEAGISSYPVLCYSGDRTAVSAASASPLQFNHVFAAIVVDASVQSPFVIDLGAHGHVLLFDPTDSYTRAGDFPAYNQGSHVLVCEPDATALRQVPFAPVENNLERTTSITTITGEGTLTGTIEIASFGGEASRARGLAEDLTQERRAAASWLRDRLPGANIERAALGDGDADHSCTLHATLSIPHYAQQIGRDLLAVKPLFVSPLAASALTAKSRSQPIILPPICDEVVFEFTLPEGYRVKECGASTRLEPDFGSYTAETSCTEGRVRFARRLVLRPVDLPAEKADELRTFLEAVRKRDRVPILLEHL